MSDGYEDPSGHDHGHYDDPTPHDDGHSVHTHHDEVMTVAYGHGTETLIDHNGDG